MYREWKRIMKSIMKTIMRNTKLVMILAFLPALLSAAQAQAVDYKSTYKGVRYEQPRQTKEYKVAATTTTPTVSFQSTSVMPVSAGVGTSTLNEDGSVNEGAYVSQRPGIRKSGGGSGYNPGTPDDEEDDEEEQQPLGDVMWPLMLCACAYLIVRATRKEEKIG